MAGIPKVTVTTAAADRLTPAVIIAAGAPKITVTTDPAERVM